MPADNAPSHYETLGIEPEAPYLEIRRAYRRLARQFHPDRLSQPTPEDQARFARMAEAYRVLSNLDRRRAYDLFLQTPRGQTARSPGEPLFRPHYSGYPYFQWDIFTPYLHGFFMGGASAARDTRPSLQTLLFNYKTLLVAIVGALYFFKFFASLEGTVLEKKVEERFFNSVSYTLTLRPREGKSKIKRVKYEIYDRVQINDQIEKPLFSMSYRINGDELPGPPLERIVMQAGLIYLAITAGLYLLERGRR